MVPERGSRVRAADSGVIPNRTMHEEANLLLVKYIQAALHHAKYELLADDGSFYGEIPVCNGVCANAAPGANAREQLAEVLEEWILFRVYKNLPLPAVDGIELTIKEVA